MFESPLRDLTVREGTGESLAEPLEDPYLVIEVLGESLTLPRPTTTG